jgi:hypothetical protein
LEFTFGVETPKPYLALTKTKALDAGQFAKNGWKEDDESIWFEFDPTDFSDSMKSDQLITEAITLAKELTLRTAGPAAPANLPAAPAK